MARGYMGKLLWVDLSKARVSEENLDEKLCRDYMGGYGLGAKILYDRMPAHTDPLGPGNILGFVAGPLTGTPALISSRYTIVAKSPLTGTWGDGNSGGSFGPAMRFAGYDAVLVTGVSPHPVSLVLDRGKATLQDATRDWGMLTPEYEDSIKSKMGKNTEVVVIGPAGEAMNLISCPISNKGRSAARSGFGAVMGAKRLKAIVAHGDLALPVAHPDRLEELRRDYLKTLTGGFADMYKNYGTPALLAGSVTSGDAPVRNWTSSADAEGWDATPLLGDEVVRRQDKRWGCWRCPLSCGGEMQSKSGRLSHKPEYETLCALGTDCLNNDLESIIKCNDLCNDYGMDTISVGATVAFAMECFEKGLITLQDTDGLDLRWGNATAIVALVEKMSRREGFGTVLADGVRVAAKRIGRGAEQFAMHVQGQELPMHDPKAVPGIGTIYHLEDAPGRHMHGVAFAIGFDPQWLRKQGIEPGDQANYGANGETYKRLTTMAHVINASGLCMFGWFCQDPDYVVRFLSAATGWDYDVDELHRVGERIANIRHAFNLREGLNPRQWNMPGRAIGSPPTGKGPLGQTTIDLDALEVAYLKAFDWDPVTTMPSAAKLAQLGLDHVARDLGIK